MFCIVSWMAQPRDPVIDLGYDWPTDNCENSEDSPSDWALLFTSLHVAQASMCCTSIACCTSCNTYSSIFPPLLFSLTSILPKKSSRKESLPTLLGHSFSKSVHITVSCLRWSNCNLVRVDILSSVWCNILIHLNGFHYFRTQRFLLSTRHVSSSSRPGYLKMAFRPFRRALSWIMLHQLPKHMKSRPGWCRIWIQPKHERLWIDLRHHHTHPIWDPRGHPARHGMLQRLRYWSGRQRGERYQGRVSLCQRGVRICEVLPV